MNNVLLLVLFVVVVGAVSIGSAGSARAAEDPASREIATGRVVEIDEYHGFLVAEFPSGRLTISVDKRELGRYILGDLIRIDSFGRPQPRVIVR